MIEFEGLTKNYGGASGPALSNLTFTVPRGEITGFVGLNGAGKTTTIRLAAGILRPSQGTVRVDGEDIVRNKTRASAQLGWVSEFPNFEPSRTPLGTILDLAAYRGLGGSVTRESALELLRQVGLGESSEARFRTFSQGMKKRLGLAVALVGSPRNFLFDETLNGLDPEGIRYVRNLLLWLRSQGCSIFLSSHILAEVERIADRIAFLHKGRLLQVLRREELDQRLGSRLRIVLENPDANALAYLNTVGQAFVSGNSIYLLNSRLPGTELNGALLQRGYRVAELHLEQEDLESYFFRLIGAPG